MILILIVISIDKRLACMVIDIIYISLCGSVYVSYMFIYVYIYIYTYTCFVFKKNVNSYLHLTDEHNSQAIPGD